MPFPMISKFFRCFVDASNKRHDHVKGTLIVRPSSRIAAIISFVISTALILGSLLTAVFMPAIFYEVAFKLNLFVYRVEFFR